MINSVNSTASVFKNFQSTKKPEKQDNSKNEIIPSIDNKKILYGLTGLATLGAGAIFVYKGLKSGNAGEKAVQKTEEFVEGFFDNLGNKVENVILKDGQAVHDDRYISGIEKVIDKKGNKIENIYSQGYLSKKKVNGELGRQYKYDKVIAYSKDGSAVKVENVYSNSGDIHCIDYGPIGMEHPLPENPYCCHIDYYRQTDVHNLYDIDKIEILPMGNQKNKVYTGIYNDNGKWHFSMGSRENPNMQPTKSDFDNFIKQIKDVLGLAEEMPLLGQSQIYRKDKSLGIDKLKQNFDNIISEVLKNQPELK